MENINNNTTNNIDINNSENIDNSSETKTYTHEEVLQLLQSEADKRVSQALKTQQKKFDKQLSLAKMDESEREKAEKDDRIAELEEQLAQFQIERNKSELKSVLASRGLSAEFVDIMNIGSDVEAAQANIEKLDKLFKAAVKAEIEKRIAGNIPKGNSSSTGEMTKEKFASLSLVEKNKIYTTNPELFNKLTN